MFKFITSKSLLANMAVGILLVAVLVMGFFASLSWITGHGQYEKVPPIVGLNLFAAKNALESKGFLVQVTDSVFSTTYSPLAVTKQIPEADAEVKHGRTIFLTVNRSIPPQIDMPSLIGFSYKSAELYLNSLGLKMGDTSYRPDFARNSVLEQLYNSAPIKPGTKIPLGSTISFVLGSGVGSGEIDVPDLIGLTFNQAKTLLTSMSLSIGSVVGVDAVKDSSNAFVVRQSPDAFSEPTPGQKMTNKTRQGTSFDLYLSTTAPTKDSTTNTTTPNTNQQP